MWSYSSYSEDKIKELKNKKVKIEIRKYPPNPPNKNKNKGGNQITNYFIHRRGQRGLTCYVLERLRNMSGINLLVNPF